jgi:hypothetical protein
VHPFGPMVAAPERSGAPVCWNYEKQSKEDGRSLSVQIMTLLEKKNIPGPWNVVPRRDRTLVEKRRKLE